MTPSELHPRSVSASRRRCLCSSRRRRTGYQTRSLQAQLVPRLPRGGKPRVAGSPGCNASHGPTADFPHPEERGARRPDARLGGQFPTHCPTHLCASGWVALTKSAAKGSLSGGQGRILLLRMAQSPPLTPRGEDANPPHSH